MPDAQVQSQAERHWLVLVPRGHDEVAFLVFVARRGEFEQLRLTFERMLRSVVISDS